MLLQNEIKIHNVYSTDREFRSKLGIRKNALVMSLFDQNQKVDCEVQDKNRSKEHWKRIRCPWTLGSGHDRGN